MDIFFQIFLGRLVFNLELSKVMFWLSAITLFVLSLLLLSSATFPPFKEIEIKQTNKKTTLYLKYVKIDLSKIRKQNKTFRKSANLLKTQFRTKIFQPAPVTVLNKPYEKDEASAQNRLL